MTDARPLRVGVLGAARITPMALLAPARRVGEATIVAVAARDAERARRFARRHDVPRVHDTYEALLADPEIEAVYNPLPNSLHAAWTTRALAAGKHVLSEKPVASNAAEAEAMAAAARGSGLVLMEAFHYRYHALFARTREILRAGELGRVDRLQAHFCIPLLRPRDIRYRADLAGGALMDTGCYAVHWLRHTAKAEPAVEHA
jgi:predicted dehydrogenase